MFTLGRNKTLSAKPSSDALSQHPLLGSTPSSLSIETSRDSNTVGSTTPPFPPSPVTLPYKPRQRHGGGAGSGGKEFYGVPPPLPSTSSVNVPTLNVTSASSASAVVQPSTVSANPTSAVVSGNSSGTSSSTGGSVTARLQSQSLKAAGQRMGLSNGSVGMQMLDGLFEKGQVSRSGSGGDWGDVLKVLTVGKATLLLPSSPSSPLPITPQTLRDHIIFASSSGGQEEMFVTLSGLVGKVVNGRIIIESCIAVDSLLMALLREPATRSAALNNLQPIHPTSADAKLPFPSYTITQPDSTLPFPPPPPPTNPSVLSPTRSRSSSNASVTGPPPSSVSRLNPFASLFGSQSGPGKDQTTAGPSKPDVAMSPDRSNFPSLKGRTPSIRSVESPSEIREMQDTEPFHIPGRVIDKVIKYGEVTKALSKAIRGRLDEELKVVPDKIVDKTFRFILSLHPMTSDSRSILSDTQTVNVDLAKPEETSDVIQQFVETMYDELYLYYLASLQIPESPSGLGSLRRRGSQNAKNRNSSNPSIPTTPTLNEAEKENGDTTGKVKNKRDMEDQAEKQATESASLIESAICNAVYNLLFSPPTADDARHDEALSSRIAALNLLELSLDHLGIQTRESADGGAKQDDIDRRNATVMSGLEDIVQAVGQELALLDGVDCHSAKQKTDHLIKAHKLITDGLSRLPPIRLRAEGEGHKSPDGSSSPLTVDVALNGDDEMAVASVDSSVPPPLPPRPQRVDTAESEVSTVGTSPIPDSTIPLETPLPDLQLPEAAATNAMEEAMSASILGHGNTGSASPEVTSSTGPAATLSRISSRASADLPSTFDGGPSGADLLLPLAIFSIVKSNPKRLVSHVLYVQRYRSAICLSGEASYAIVNLTAVIEFLEHVDLAELGLTSAEKVMSVADLSPIGLTYYEDKNADAASIASASSRILGRVNQVGEMAGSANKVLAGVVDSGWSALRGLLAPNLAMQQSEEFPSPSRPSLPVRKSSAFSIHTVTASVASIAAAAASHRGRPRAYTMPTEREMTEVTSRPASIHDGIEEQSEDDDSSEVEDEPAPPTSSKHLGVNHEGQTRVRSVSSGGKVESDKMDRMSISDRFANMTVLGKLSTGDKPLATPTVESSSISSFLGNLGNRSTHTRQSSLLGSPQAMVDSSTAGEGISLPISHLPSSAEDMAPPIDRFMTCDVSDLRLAEVGELLRDYRRLARLVSTNKS